MEPEISYQKENGEKVDFKGLCKALEADAHFFPQSMLETKNSFNQQNLMTLVDDLLNEDSKVVNKTAKLLYELTEGTESVSAFLRIRLLSTPSALESICHALANAKETWRVVNPSGLMIRAGPGLRYERIGNIVKNQLVQIIQVQDFWMKMAKPPPGFSHGWVSSQDPVNGKIYMNRVCEDDEGKMYLTKLLLTLCQTRHFCMEVLKHQNLTENVAFMAVVAPNESALKEQAQQLFARLHMTRILLQGPSIPGSRPAHEKSFHTQTIPHAPELHALRVNKNRISPRKTVEFSEMEASIQSFSKVGRPLSKESRVSSFDRVL